MEREFKNGRTYTFTLTICSDRSVTVMKWLKQLFFYLKYKIRYRRIGPKHTPKIPWQSTKMPSRDRKIRAAGYQ